jgi:hypothetical protein
MKASHYGILNLKREAANLKSWTSDDPKDLYGKDLQQMYNEIRIQLMRYAGHVSRNIGGYLIQYKGKTENGDVYGADGSRLQHGGRSVHGGQAGSAL